MPPAATRLAAGAGCWAVGKYFYSVAACLFAYADDGDECRDRGDCINRYKQQLVMLGCLGCLISYYAFTIGFLGAGPVTWLYQVYRLMLETARR